ncbi:MAG: hypothetical protein U0T74_05730 [Chitinophagales bacterium]
MMKEIAKIFLVLTFILSISACERKSCQNVVCPTGQSCNSGQCYCQDGLEGTNCTEYSYEKYVRTYNYTSESCNPVTPFSTGSVFIQHDFSSSLNQIQIYNLMGGYCTYVTAVIRTDYSNKGNILEIPEQNYNCSGNIVSGQGTYDALNNRINLQLYYTFGGLSYQCNTILQ